MPKLVESISASDGQRTQERKIHALNLLARRPARRVGRRMSGTAGPYILRRTPSVPAHGGMSRWGGTGAGPARPAVAEQHPLQDRTAAAGTFAAGLVFNLVGLTEVWSLARVDSLAAGPGGGTRSCWPPAASPCSASAAIPCSRSAPVPSRRLADLALGGSIALVLVVFDLLFSAGQFATARARTAVTTAVFVIIGTASVVGGLAAGRGPHRRLHRSAADDAAVRAALVGGQHPPAAPLGDARRRADDPGGRPRRARGDGPGPARRHRRPPVHDGDPLRCGVLSLPPDTERDREALRAVRTSSLAALEEMRSMILLLRADDALAKDPTVPGALDRLPELVEAAAVGGPADRRAARGDPGDSRRWWHRPSTGSSGRR